MTAFRSSSFLPSDGLQFFSCGVAKNNDKLLRSSTTLAVEQFLHNARCIMIIDVSALEIVSTFLECPQIVSLMKAQLFLTSEPRQAGQEQSLRQIPVAQHSPPCRDMGTQEDQVPTFSNQDTLEIHVLVIEVKPGLFLCNNNQSINTGVRGGCPMASLCQRTDVAANNIFVPVKALDGWEV